MSRIGLFLKKQFMDDGTETGPDSIGLWQFVAGCLFGVLVAASLFLIANLVGDLMLFVAASLSACAFLAPMPSVIYASVRSRKDRHCRYLAYGFACLFATLQGFLLVFAGLFLSGAFWGFTVTVWSPLTLALLLFVYCRRHGRVRWHILSGGSVRNCFLSARQARVLYVCLAVLVALFVLYFSTGFRAEWGGLALIPIGLVLMVLYSREAVALSAYCFIRRLDVGGFWILPTK